ncbi:hypothetical protein D5H75_06965 [Bailinhaonella thermotolerans]|uniref:XRE family transcriptional regulator n=2 Tax=Bailinhaonella thermotolerans TaxID=1070861 RepID=A0A3A4AWC7_9ACTN|nr:hypothetical protein D5H75_06965 [Bailinhaonella thermotolerans]
MAADRPDPRDAETPAEFMLQMRRLKAWSGLTFRQLEARAVAAGRPLPHSTLVAALRRDTLPREELVAAFAAACGCPEEGVAQWVDRRRRLAMDHGHRPPPDDAAAEAVRDDDSPDADPAAAARSTPGGRSYRLPALVLAAALMAAGIWWAIVLGTGASAEDPPPSPRPSRTAAQPSLRPAAHLPASATGFHRIRLVASGRCLSTGRGKDSQVKQTTCEQRFPLRSVRPVGDGTYQIATLHPEFGSGCMGIRNGQVHDDWCGGRGGNESERFWLEPAATGGSGYLIRVAHSSLCVGLPHPPGREGTPLALLPCDPGARGQVFAFEADPDSVIR